MPAAAVAALRCPVCRDTLADLGGRLACPAGHSFDVARHGQVHLAARPIRHPGDTADMVAARARVEQAGVLAPVGEEVRAAVGDLLGARGDADRRDGPVLLDVGAGTGHLLAAVLDDLPSAVGLAVDSSRYASRRAGRAHPRLLAVMADVTEPLPVGDAAVDVALVVFAPRPVEEMARALRAGGGLVVATPREGHMAPLRDALGLLDVAEDKGEQVASALAGAFEMVGRTAVDAVVEVANSEDSPVLLDWVMSGPNAFHVSAEAMAARIAAHLPSPSVEVQVAVDVHTFRRRPSPSRR